MSSDDYTEERDAYFSDALAKYRRDEKYRISYQKYLMATPGNFASVRDAVDDAFRAGWEEGKR